MVDSVAGLISDLAENQEISAIGVAAAGFMDKQREHVLYAPNLNWRNEPLKSRLEQRVGRPLIIENDANAAGWAEFRFGAAQRHDSMVMLTLGTGVGGAIVIDGELMSGGFGIAGELGHITVVDDGELCGCGRRGCLEQYSSGSALLRESRKLAEVPGKGDLLAQLHNDKGELTGHEVYQAVLQGDEGTLELVDVAARRMAQGMASIVAVLDPEIFVIGGGLSELGDVILDPIKAEFERQLPARGFRPVAEIEIAHFTNHAGVVGAADLAMQQR
jgi:glucokinase